MLVAIVSMILRVAATLAMSTAVFILAALTGFFGGSSKADGLIWASAAVFMTGIAWSLLPLFRHSRLSSHVTLAMWFVFGIYLLLFFGEGDARGWVAGPWLLATVIAGALIPAKPPDDSAPADDQK